MGKFANQVPGQAVRRAAYCANWARLLLLILLVLSVSAVYTKAARAQEGSGPSGKITGNGMELEWQVSGAEVGQHFFAERTWQAPGKVTSNTVRFSGVMRSAVPTGVYTDSNMSAYISLPMGGEKKEVTWGGELSDAKGLSHELPFDFTLDVPPGSAVLLAASVNQVGGTSDLLAVFFQFDAMPVPTASCTATVSLNSEPQPGRKLDFRTEVVNPNGSSLMPTNESWLFNGVDPLSNPWDGSSGILEYSYLCPMDNQQKQASIDIPAFSGVLPPDAQSGVPGWMVIVGGVFIAGAGLAVLGGGGLLVASSLKKGGKTAPQTPRYILDVERSYLEVKAKERVALRIRTLRLNPQGGGPVPAPEAVIQVIVPPSPAGLFASPNTGQGSLTCYFSIPNPKICADLRVIIIASAGGSRTQTSVLVRIIPLYELEVQWHDPQQGVLQPGGKEVWAKAWVTVTPSDPQSTPETLASQITLKVEGLNCEWIKLKTLPPDLLTPYVQSGMLWIPITMSAPGPASSTPGPGNPSLAARFNAANQNLEKRLTLDLSEPVVFDIWGQGNKQVDVVFSPVKMELPVWFFGEITSFFHPPQDDSKVSEPPDGCSLLEYSLVCDPPDLLELINYGEERPGYAIGEVCLKSGVDLEQVFGPDLIDKNARITLTLALKDGSGRQYTSSPIIYQLCPTAELVMFMCDEYGAPVNDRSYNGLKLESMEFLTDGKDNLNLAAAYRRTDWPAATDRVVPFGCIQQASLVGSFSQLFACAPIEFLFGDESLGIIHLSADKAVLTSQPRQAAQLKLKVSAFLQNKPVHYRVKVEEIDLSTRSDIVEQEVRPIFPSIQLWVVPGRERGVSIAGATAMITRPNRQPEPWPTAPELELTTDCKNFRLEITPFDNAQFIRRERDPKSGDSLDWLQSWRLNYSGLNWENVFGAWGRVFCRFADADEAVVFEMTLKENLDRMFTAFNADIASLDLTNSEFREGYGLLQLLAILRGEVRGPFYNIRNSLIRFFMPFYSMGADHPYEKYMCSALSLRLLRYFLDRRHGALDPNTALHMNGIEFASYGFYLRVIGAGLHSWIGFYPSGMRSDQSPVFMDPWWRQDWDNDACTFDYGYAKQNVKATLVTALIVSEIALIARVAYSCLKQIAAEAGRICPSLQVVYNYIKDKIIGKAKDYVLDKLKKIGIENKIPDKPSLIFSGLAGFAWIMTPIQVNTDIGGQIEDASSYKACYEINLFEHFYSEFCMNSATLPAKIERWPL